MPSSSGASIAEDMELLDRRLKQLKLDYEQYFLGARPREPALLRGEVQKLIAIYSNQPIQNTALRFKFNNLCSRFFAFRRRWDTTLRQIEEGTYERHVFKARLHERDRRDSGSEQAGSASESTPAAAAGSEPSEDLFRSYLTARKSCGEDVRGLTRERLQDLLKRKAQAIRSRYGCQQVQFRVVVEGGRAKLKASAARSSEPKGT